MDTFRKASAQVASGMKHPFYEELTEEKKESEEEEEEAQPTDMVCGGCLESITLGEDVALLQLVVPYINEKGIQYAILFDDQGEPEAEPLFFSYECWENTAESIAEAIADAPALEEPGSVLECDYCKSSVRMGEKCVAVQLGELITSERRPPRSWEEEVTTFLPTDDQPYILCLSCTRTFIELEEVEIWTHISQNGECPLCTRGRCWRVGKCTCKCHHVQG